MGVHTTLATGGHPTEAVRGILARLLREGIVDGVLVPARHGAGRTVQQTLITDPERMRRAEPFAPVATVNGGRVLSTLLAQPTGRPVAAVLRSCEIRAFVELVKLHQGTVDDLLRIGIDCLGRYENRDYLALAETTADLADAFLRDAPAGDGAVLGRNLAPACRICERPVAENVDLRLGVLGTNPDERLDIEWLGDKGRRVRETLGLEQTDAPPEGRDEAVRILVEKRAAFGRQHLDAFRERTKDFAGLSTAVADCVVCTNCRVACPVCYCRHCVFTTDTFRHAGDQYLQWAEKWGDARLPGDNVFYHLTRMVHISTLCVGCGQCSSACPNDVPVMELIRTVADRTQARFDYEPGRRLDEAQPLAVFEMEELGDVTGQVK